MKNSERLALVQPKVGWHRRTWRSAGLIKRVFLVGWFAAVLISNIGAGVPLLWGVGGAYGSTVIVALILNALTRKTEEQGAR